MKHSSKASFMMLGQFKYFHKFVMISLIMLVVLIIFIGQLAFQSLFMINFSKKELQGIDYLNPLIKVTESIQNYRYAELNYLLDEKNADKLVRAQKEADAAIEVMERTNNNLGVALRSSQEWTELKSEWEMIKQSRVIDPTKSNFDNASMLIKNLDDFINHVCDTSNLTLDPEILTYYLGDTYCTKLPTYIEELTLIRDISDKSFRESALSQDDRKLLIINENLMDEFDKLAIKNNLDKVSFYLEDTNSLSILSVGLINTLVSETTNLVSLLNGSLLAYPPNMSAAIQPTRFSNLLTVAYTLNKQVQDVFTISLEARIQKIHHRFYINIAISLLALILVAYLFAGIYHSIVRNSRKLLHHAKQMEEGDFHHIINIKTQDEMANAAAHLDSMRHSFFLITHEINHVLEKVVSGKDVSARATLKCEGLFDKLETNVNAIARLVENLTKHSSKLIQSAHLDTITATVESLQKITTHSQASIQQSADLMTSSQEDLQPHYQQVDQLLTELKLYYRDEHENLKGDIHTLEDVVLQMRILSLNIASLVKKKKIEGQQDELIQFATEIRELAERIFGISHMIKTIETSAEKQRGVSAKLIDSVHACHATWSKSINKVSAFFKDLLQGLDKQQQDVSKLDQTQKHLHKIADEIEEHLPNSKSRKK